MTWLFAGISLFPDGWLYLVDPLLFPETLLVGSFVRSIVLVATLAGEGRGAVDKRGSRGGERGRRGGERERRTGERG